MHENQVGQNLRLVKKSFKKYRKSIIEGGARFTVRDIA